MNTKPTTTEPFFRHDLPAHVGTEQVSDFNLYAAEMEGMDLFASLHRLHELGLPDVFWTRHNGGHWVALRASAIHDIVKNPQTFSSVNWHVPASMDYKTKFYVPFMSDTPVDASYRRIASLLFSPKRILGLEDGIRSVPNRHHHGSEIFAPPMGGSIAGGSDE
jgi:cytochrome P450